LTKRKAGASSPRPSLVLRANAMPEKRLIASFVRLALILFAAIAVFWFCGDTMRLVNKSGVLPYFWAGLPIR